MGTIGLFKIPFGFEVVQSDRDRLFLERSTAERALFPGEYDVGARLHGRLALRPLRGRRAERRADRREAASRCAIRTPPRTSTGGSASTRRSRRASGSRAAFSGLTGKGFHAGTPATKATVQWNDRNGNGVLRAGRDHGHPGRRGHPVAELPALRARRRPAPRRHDPERSARRCSTASSTGPRTSTAASCRPIRSPSARDYREFGALRAPSRRSSGRTRRSGVRYDFYNPDADSTNQVMGAPAADGARLPDAVAWPPRCAAPSGGSSPSTTSTATTTAATSQGNPTNLADNAFIVRGEVSF